MSNPPYRYHTGLWFCYVLTIQGAPVVLKNSKQIRRRGPGGKPFITSSDAAKAWMNDAVYQLNAQWHDKGKRHAPIPRVWLNASIVSYVPTRLRPDASNLYQGPEDALEHAGIIDNDYSILSHDGSRRHKTNENPRVVITLTPAKEMSDGA